jgi:hypothetical protein
MGKFKKGDAVRLIKSEDYNRHGRYGKTGEIGTVIQYDAVDHTYYVDFTESGKWWAKASNLETFAATLKIEAGKFYKTRDGRKVGPLISNWCDNEHWPFRWPEQTMYYKPNGFSCPGSAHLHRDADDIIAEWIDEPVAKASNDNTQPKFKVGDRVEITANDNYRVSFVGSFGTIKTVPTNAAAGFRVELDDGREFPFWPSEMTVRPSSAPPTTTIVALIENGQPKPSSTPHVHASTGAAEKEAKRLAAKYKGKQFGVFTLTATHEEPAPVYDHKWQNMAALGLKIDAIRELRAVAGLDLLSAKRAVEAFENAA